MFANKGSDSIQILLEVWFKIDKENKYIELIVKKEISIILKAIRYKYIIHI